MSCIHTIYFLCGVLKLEYADISGNADNDRGLDQLACQLSTVNKIFTFRQWSALQIIKTPEDLHTGWWSLSFQSSIRREGDPIRTMMLTNIPEWSRQSFSSYAETDRSRLSYTPICYHKQKRRDLFQNRVDPHSDFLEKNPVCLARYRSKYTNRTAADQKKSKYTK